jgi:hypothetical protein
LVDRFSGEAIHNGDRAARRQLGEHLDALMKNCGTSPGLT